MRSTASQGLTGPWQDASTPMQAARAIARRPALQRCGMFRPSNGRAFLQLVREFLKAQIALRSSAYPKVGMPRTSRTRALRHLIPQTPALIAPAERNELPRSARGRPPWIRTRPAASDGVCERRLTKEPMVRMASGTEGCPSCSTAFRSSRSPRSCCSSWGRRRETPGYPLRLSVDGGGLLQGEQVVERP